MVHGMIDRGLFRSAGFRFGAIYALLLAISATALALFLWWATAGLLDRQTEAAINADAQGLAERWADGGLPALVVTIEDRLAQNIDDDAIYLLVDPNMKRVAGNLASWPPSVTEAGPWYELPVMRAGIKSLANVQRYDLPGGFHLLIGRDVQVRAQLRTLLTDALLWAVVVVLLMATVGALVVRSLFRRTLANVSATAAAIAGGDFAQRVKLSGRGDEFDQVAEVINDMLDRIGRLMDGVRQVSNAIAHDLRTPITRARTRLEDAALHAETPDDLRAAIERATMDLDGIVAVFQALLRIAEIEAGSRRSSFARLDLAPLLAEIADLYSAAGGRSRHRAAARNAGGGAGIRRQGDDPAGDRQSGGQRGEVLARGRDGAVECVGFHHDLHRGQRPGAGHRAGGTGEGDRPLLSRRVRAQHAGIGAGTVAGAGGRSAARRRAAPGRQSAGTARHPDPAAGGG